MITNFILRFDKDQNKFIYDDQDYEWEIQLEIGKGGNITSLVSKL